MISLLVFLCLFSVFCSLILLSLSSPRRSSLIWCFCFSVFPSLVSQRLKEKSIAYEKVKALFLENEKVFPFAFSKCFFSSVLMMRNMRWKQTRKKLTLVLDKRRRECDFINYQSCFCLFHHKKICSWLLSLPAKKCRSFHQSSFARLHRKRKMKCSVSQSNTDVVMCLWIKIEK